jgi:hypothetical protein
MKWSSHSKVETTGTDNWHHPAIRGEKKRRNEGISPRHLHLEKWAREELNLRPHAYQASQSESKVRHLNGLRRGRGSIRRPSPRKMPEF